MQQSAPAKNGGGQLSLPQVRLLLHSSSESQSPSPTPHRCDDEQQLHESPVQSHPLKESVREKTGNAPILTYTFYRVIVLPDGVKEFVMLICQTLG